MHARTRTVNGQFKGQLARCSLRSWADLTSNRVMMPVWRQTAWTHDQPGGQMQNALDGLIVVVIVVIMI